MKRLALLGSTLLLTAAMLTSCATPTVVKLSDADLAVRHLNEERMRSWQQPSEVPGLTKAELALKQIKEAREQQHREELGYESATATQANVSGWDVVRGLVALPIVIPLAAMVEYGRGPYSSYVHCRSWTYKDAYHASCY